MMKSIGGEAKLETRPPNLSKRCLWLVAVMFLTGNAATSMGAGKEESVGEIDFNRDIRPILSGKCFACHGPDEEGRGADLRLDTEEGSRDAIFAGDPEASELIYRITSEDADELMPPPSSSPPLSEEQVALMRQWISEGAEYAKHWSYQPIKRPVVPQASHPEWIASNEIDHFIQKSLHEQGLAPAAQANRYVLARRVALDLTGLPPTWNQVQRFVKDSSDDAYESYVNELLASPTYGERWASMWLDLARYADSAGYADDRPRSIWLFRDWVINAFNQNQPFDDFTIEQLAGDLLTEPSGATLVATAFHRNTTTNSEGGTNDEEFRNAAIVDRVNTTFEVWMGTTMACAQCHTHKYDPITQAEYFQIFDGFNQTEDADRSDEKPLHEVWTEDQLALKLELQQQLDSLQNQIDSETPELIAERTDWLASLGNEPNWKPLRAATADGGDVKLEVGDEGWIRLKHDKSDQTDYSLTYEVESDALTGISLEVGPDQAANFVLSQLKASWTSSETSDGIEGRYVRIELPGKSKMIHLAEVQVFQGEANIALESTVKQSSTGYGGVAKRAIDGNTDGEFDNASVTHTNSETDPWIELDLGSEKRIDRIVIWNRTDNGLEKRLAGFRVKVLDDSRRVAYEQVPERVPEPSSSIRVSSDGPVQFVVASADYSQKGFPAASVLADKIDSGKGWAIAGQLSRTHRLQLVLKSPIQPAHGKLTVELKHRSKYSKALLTHFRMATADDPRLERWAEIPEGIRSLLHNKERNSAQEKRVTDYHRTIAKTLQKPRSQLAALKKKLAALKPSTVPVMRERPAEKRRESFVQIRGNYKNTGEAVSMNTPEAFPTLPIDAPRNRLGLAYWLVNDENPLTARVVVNRFWEQLFGVGIVPTSEEFGTQGEPPTHPELLDWLASEFRESGWDVKGLIKLMVMSSTYQQDSATTPELLERDPLNQQLARGPRFRVSAEMVRDQALFAAGLLSDKMFGPPVKPPQPDLGLKAAFGGALDWKTSDGEDRYRRALYTQLRRSNPYPSMVTFDAPNREVCVSRRGRTNTPLQALVTLNDPVFVEAAQGLARRVLRQHESNTDDVQSIQLAWQLVLQREPSELEIQRMTVLLDSVRETYAADPPAAKQMATDPIGPAPANVPIAELAAWTVVSNVLLNVDEVFLKR